MRTTTLLLALFTSSSALAVPPTLSVGGTCPGSTTFTVTSGTPGRNLAWITSTGPGATSIPGGACAGTPLGLDPAGMQLRAVRRNNNAGDQSITVNLPGAACSSWVQVVDLDTCTASPATPITPAGPVTGWDTHIGARVDSSYSVLGIDQLANGDLIVAGGGSPPFIARLLPDGTVNSLSQLPSLGELTAVDALSTGGFVVAGQFDDCCTFGDPTVLRFDASGGFVSGSQYDHGYFEQGFYAIKGRNDGGVFVAGIFDQAISPGGALEWNSLHVGGGGNVNGIDSPDDNTLFVGGEGSYGFPADSYNHVVAKLDGSGNVIWNVSFGQAGYEWGSDVVATPNGGAVLSGWTDSPGLQVCDLVRLNNAGDILWSSIYGIPGVNSSCRGITATADGGFVATGTIGSDILLLKVDAGGAVEWSTNLGPGTGWDVVALAGGGYAVAAADAATELHVIRTDANGTTGCDAPAGVMGSSYAFAHGDNTANSPQSPTSAPAFHPPSPLAVAITAECL